MFRRLSPEDRSDIQRALMSEKQFKLKQRFVDFIVGHTTNSFFTDEAERIPRALPRSKLEASLKTLYETRLGFVHQLTKVREQITPFLKTGETTSVSEGASAAPPRNTEAFALLHRNRHSVGGDVPKTDHNRYCATRRDAGRHNGIHLVKTRQAGRQA